MYEAMKLQLTETKRVVAYYDADTYALEDIVGDCLKVQPLRTDDRLQTKYLSTDDEHAPAVARFVEAFHYFNHEKNYRELRERAIGLYFSLRGIPYQFTMLNDGSSWADVVIYDDVTGGTWVTEPNAADGIEAWFNGEIYTLAIEELETYTNERNGAKIEKWEVVDSVGACLIDELTLDTVSDVFGKSVLETAAA